VGDTVIENWNSLHSKTEEIEDLRL